MKISNKDFPLLFAFTFIISIHKISHAVDAITTSQTLRDGDTIVSSDGTFELGFFSQGKSTNRYVGIWYKRITVMTVVWVANREVPLTNTSGLLKVINPGLLVLQNDTNGVIIWSSNTSRPVKTPIAKLLDSGNLVVKDGNDDDPKNFLWESFNYPTDTLLPGMKFGWNFKTGNEVYLSSWKSKYEPASGDFTYHFDPLGYPQSVMKRGLYVTFKSGPWNGLRFSGLANMRKNPFYKYKVVLNKNEAYFTYELHNKSIISRVTLSESGVSQRLTWVDTTQGWVVYITSPTDNCDIYRLCGAYGSCNVASSPVCVCLDRFVPKDPDGWNMTNWSSGCVRRTPLNCTNGDAFLKYSGIKLPDTQYSRFNESGFGYKHTGDHNDENHNEIIELSLFDLHAITKATDNFSINSKLGEGGFGPVYKEIAVKRLSRTSHQGLVEFKNEVNCIAKLQHRNLVKLLGYCIHGEEKILTYEYMPNRSLDLILFDLMGSALLDWPKRFHIINGIARGLMYLHQDSRLRVIHRDLKASNILLDSDMNPKISDFGMARIFGGNETEANTSRAWMLYREGRSLELVDANLGISDYLSEVLRSIHAGLLCVQKCPEDRPSMSSLVLMLGNEGVLPQAKQPGFFTERDLFTAKSSSSTSAAISINQVTITLLEAR
ncbi:G-type lectin S-receptor-like serine threonine-kinase At4g27290 [Olea europaea subsp. europaea]|uniref:G-type lectin S-receptor-like serine threonine-kinase At4g27290 n=1 Tax=Olea europaea subsp. europaea TaxID=158383 RepID=A0A8S0PKK6_OLEEU|nr:G-type lectin S-receptor-like serine threonine-kinase At4g27290 [Olea europaea subsp. europaea]